jgi:hypothetical protein
MRVATSTEYHGNRFESALLLLHKSDCRIVILLNDKLRRVNPRELLMVGSMSEYLQNAFNGKVQYCVHHHFK